MISISTITDRNYLFRTLTLIDSIYKTKIFILCQDIESLVFLKKYKIKNNNSLKLIYLDEIEGIEELKKNSINRNHREFSVSLKPYLINSILINNNIEILVNLDSDTYFFNYEKFLLKNNFNFDAILSLHDYSKKNIKKKIYGVVNTGIISFRNNDNGRKIVNWWKKKCYEKCSQKVDDNSYLDQKYADEIKKIFKNVGQFDHQINVAPWNIDNYNLELNNNNFTIDNEDLIMFHFQNLKPLYKGIFYSALSEYGLRLNKKNIKKLYINYLIKLKENYNLTKKLNTKKFLPLKFFSRAVLFNDFLIV